MNPKYNYSPALQEDARRFEERLNEAGDISSFGTTVRNKRQGKRHNRVHPGHFVTQQGTPFYPAGMSAADWSTLVFTLPRRKMAWVHPTMAIFFQNCTLILDEYPVCRKMRPFHRSFLPQKSLSAPAKGHQNTHLPALNIQCETGIKDLHPAPHRLFTL